jgi:hypothetical protein
MIIQALRARLFKAGLTLTLGQNLTCCFSLCISAHPSVLKLHGRKLSSVQTRFLKKYFQVYNQAVGKFAFEF